METLQYIFIAFAALVGETFGTIFGGGSFLVQPALLSVGVSPHMAVANDVTAAVFSDIFFVLHSFRKYKPDWQIARWMMPGIILSAVFGGLLLSVIPEKTEKWIILSVCCGGLGYMLFRIKTFLPQEAGYKRLFPYWRVVTLIASVALGTYEGISGAGSGVLFITVITLIFQIDMKSAVILTNILEIAGLGAAALTFWSLGLLDAKLLTILIPACCIAGILGSKIMHAIPEKTLRIIFACCIAALIIHIAMAKA